MQAEPDNNAQRNTCPACGRPHAAYALFPPPCQHPNDRYTYFVDGKPAWKP